MTNKQAIREDLAPYPIRSSQIERQCLKHSLNPDGEVDESIVSMCVLEILSQMIALGGVSEGGVSFSFESDKAKDRVRSICKRYGLDYGDYIQVATVTRLE